MLWTIMILLAAFGVGYAYYDYRRGLNTPVPLEEWHQDADDAQGYVPTKAAQGESRGGSDTTSKLGPSLTRFADRKRRETK